MSESPANEQQDLERQAEYVDAERPAADTGAPDPEAPAETGGLTSAVSGGRDADRDDAGLADAEDDPQTRPIPDAEDAADDEFIRENAETSLDQPSESVE